MQKGSQKSSYDIVRKLSTRSSCCCDEQTEAQKLSNLPFIFQVIIGRSVFCLWNPNLLLSGPEVSPEHGVSFCLGILCGVLNFYLNKTEMKLKLFLTLPWFVVQEMNFVDSYFISSTLKFCETTCKAHCAGTLQSFGLDHLETDWPAAQPYQKSKGRISGSR